MRKIVIFVGIAALLIGCEAAPESTEVTQEPRFVTAERDLLNLANDLDKLEISNIATLPTAGTARYDGAIIFSEAAYSLIGDLQVDVSFASDAIGGRATDFVDSNNTDFDGQLDISDGSINRGADPLVENQFSATMDGVLTSEQGSALIQSTVGGNFLGENREAIAGAALGTATTIEGTGFVGLSTVDGVGLVIGEFGAKR